MCSRHLVLQPTEEWATSSKVVRDSVRKRGKQTLRDKPVSGTPGLCLSSCRQALHCLPLMMNHNCMFGGGVDLSNRSQGEQLGLALLLNPTLSIVWISSPRVCSLAPRDPHYLLLTCFIKTHPQGRGLSVLAIGWSSWLVVGQRRTGVSATPLVLPWHLRRCPQLLGSLWQRPLEGGLACLWRPPTPI